MSDRRETLIGVNFTDEEIEWIDKTRKTEFGTLSRQKVIIYCVRKLMKGG